MRTRVLASTLAVAVVAIVLVGTPLAVLALTSDAPKTSTVVLLGVAGSVLALARIGGEPCVVLRLRAGGTTTIPVRVLGADPEEFVRELRRRLDHGRVVTRPEHGALRQLLPADDLPDQSELADVGDRAARGHGPRAHLRHPRGGRGRAWRRGGDCPRRRGQRA